MRESLVRAFSARLAPVVTDVVKTARPATPSAGRLGFAGVTVPAATLVLSSGGIQAQRRVRSAADHADVVIILAVVFAAALAADVIAAVFIERHVTAARTRVRVPARGARTFR